MPHRSAIVLRLLVKLDPQQAGITKPIMCFSQLQITVLRMSWFLGGFSIANHDSLPLTVRSVASKSHRFKSDGSTPAQRRTVQLNVGIWIKRRRLFRGAIEAALAKTTTCG